MPKATGKASGGGGGSKKWIAKKEEAETPAAPPPAPVEEKEEELKDEDITSPILLELKSSPKGPKYDVLSMLRYFQLAKKEEDEEAEGDTIERKLSMTERPVTELPAAAVDGSKTPKKAREKKLGKKGSFDEPETPSKRISLSQELPSATPSYGAMAPEMAWYIQQMYGAAPMSPMYSPGYTTVMLRNIPNRYTREMLAKRLDDGYKDEYDFVYLPIDFNSKCNVGYAFINFRTPAASTRFMQEFNRAKTKTVLPGFSSTKVCEVSFARVQGRDANMENLRDEKFIEKLTERPEWQPLFLDEKGEEIPFAKTLGTGRKRSRGDSNVAAAPQMPMPMGSPTAGWMYGGASPYGMYPSYGFGMPTGPVGKLPIESVLQKADGMLMVRGIPTTLTTEKLLELLAKDFKGQYDFVFLPLAESGDGNRGFFFINIKAKKKAEAFTTALNGEKPSGKFGAEATEDEKAMEVVAARLKNVDKIFSNVLTKSKSDKKDKIGLPMLFGNDGKEIPWPEGATAMAAPPATSQAAPKAKGKAKAKAKADSAPEEGGAPAAPAKGEKGEKPQKKKGGPPPPPSQPPPPIAGGYPPYGYPYGYAGMPQVNPQYAQAMAQAAHAHARAAAAAHAGQQQMMAGRIQSGLLDPLAAAVNPGSGKPLDEEQRTALRGQIEFYFSVDNLCKDVYLRSHMNADGWTPVELIAQFPQVRKYKANEKDIIECLKTSEIIEVDPATSYLRLKDEELRKKWAQVPNQYRQTYPAKKKAPGS